MSNCSVSHFHTVVHNDWPHLLLHHHSQSPSKCALWNLWSSLCFLELFSLCFPHLVLMKIVSPLIMLHLLCSARGNRFISCITKAPLHSRTWRKSKWPLVLTVIADHCSSCLSKLHRLQALKFCIQTTSPAAIGIYGFPRHFSSFLGDVSFWPPVIFSKATLAKFLMIFCCPHKWTNNKGAKEDKNNMPLNLTWRKWGTNHVGIWRSAIQL